MRARLDTRVSRRSLLRGFAASAAGVSAAAIVGCGGDDSDPTATATRELSTPEASPTPGPTSSPEPSGWTQVNTAAPPSARRDHSLSAASTGLILMFGGRAGSRPLGDLWSFDPPSATWRQLSAEGEGPPARFGHNAFFDANVGRLVITMGQAGSTFFNDLWGFELNSMTWRQVNAPNPPASRYGAGGAHDAEANRIYVSHGFTDSGRFDDTWDVGLQSDQGWSQLPISGELPVKRCLHRSAWLDGKRILLFGGQTNDEPFLGDMWVLDVDAGTWTQQSPATLPGPRNLYGAALDSAGGHWFVVGGNTPDGASGEAWAYDIGADSWRMLEASLPAGRQSTDAAVAGGRLYIFGGRGEGGDLNDTWMLPLGT